MTRFDWDWIVSLAAAITLIVCSMTFAATLVAAHNRYQRELEQRWILPKEDRPTLIPDDNAIEVT